MDPPSPRPLPLLPLILFLIALVAPATAISREEQICHRKNPHVVSAIQLFCQNTAMTVPSVHAQTGVHYGPQSPQSPNNLNLYIHGTCSPPQWVPQQYCLSQFYSICATGGPRGGGSRRFGRDACQEWVVKIQKPGIVITPIN